ncbi:hypothetical protein ACJQWK_04509 [Exserohilum turcicum]
MVGWRDKPAPQQLTRVEPHENGASKFRRKLSHGLAFISSPLSQRKITPGRSQARVPSLAVTEPSATDITSAASACDALIPSVREPISPGPVGDSAGDSTKQADINASPKIADAHIARKPLSRSCTTSFIPLPAKTESNTFATDIEGAVMFPSLTTISQPAIESVLSKIPTPSPPLSERRCASPRRYLQHHASYNTSQQMKHITSAHTFATSNGSPAKNPQALRSRTTPNFVKGPHASQSAGFMAPRRPGSKRPIVYQKVQGAVLQENIPVHRHVVNRYSQIQERPLKRESLAMPPTLYSRRSFCPSTSTVPSRNTSFATPQTARRPSSLYFAPQTPVTVKRIQPEGPATPKSPKHSVTKPGPILQSPFVDTLPAPKSTETDSKRPTLTRSHTELHMQRKTLGTPNGLGGVWRPSPALAVATHEVSKLPRYNSLHNFGSKLEAAPPVLLPPIQTRKSPLPDQTPRPRMDSGMPTTPRPGRVVSDATSCQSGSEETDEGASHNDTKVLAQACQIPSPCETQTESTISLAAFPSVPKMASPRIASPELGEMMGSLYETPSEPSGDMQEQEVAEDADMSVFQVKDYMPPLYWAGRFQSRYDQWRTEAMNAELKMHTDHEVSTQLSEYKLDQEKLAICYIFAQLRDLCTTDQAIDSLWEFEYKYRKDHKLLSSPSDLSPKTGLKQGDGTNALGMGGGAFGRAIRKLTPRKSSFANLVKVKGRNKSDETKQNETSEQNQEICSDNS